MNARSFIVPSRWIGLDKTRRLSPTFWMGVRDQLRFSKIDPDKASDLQVQQAIRRFDALSNHRPKSRVLTGPAYWASGIINGDWSGISDAESLSAQEWLKKELRQTELIIDVKRDRDGNGIEQRFTWSFRLHGGDADGGEVIDYIVMEGQRANA